MSKEGEAIADVLNPGGDNAGQVIMDLGDFVPEKYELSFSISGRKYLFKYEEVHVDEVLRMMMLGEKDEKDGEDSNDYIKRNRRTVYDFLSKYITEGDVKKLKVDLDQVPFRSNRDGLSIIKLLAQINVRSKKKDDGAE